MADIKVERGTRTPPKKAAPPIAAPPSDLQEQRTDAIDGIWQLAGLGCIMVGQFSDAGAIEMHGHNVSVEVAKLAETNSGIAKGVDMLLQVGPYAGLVTAIMPLALQLLANHKIVPAEKLASANVVRPEVLESQVKTLMAQQAMEALKQQQEAEQELQRMQAEMAAAQNGEKPNNDPAT